PHWRPLERPEHLAEYWRAAQERRPLHGDALLGRGWPCLHFRAGDFEVRVAWLRDVDGVQGAMVVGREGKRLGEFRLPVRWGPLWAEVEGPFVATPEVALDHRLAEAVLAMLSRFHDLLGAVVEQPGPGD